MSAPIIPGEALIHREEGQETVSPRYMERTRGVAKLFLAYALGITGYNGAQYADMHLQANRDDVQMVEDAERCEPFSYVEVEPSTGKAVAPRGFTLKQAEQTITTEQKYAKVRSAAENLEPEGIRPDKFINQLLDINSGEFASFTSRYSGADIHLYTETETPIFTVYPDVIDELMHASLREDLTFDHVSISQFMDCARDQILLSRGGTELKGERVNLYIAGKPGVCWSNAHIQSFPKDTEMKFSDFCDSVGVTKKDLKFDIIPGILSYEQTWMAVMTHHHDTDTANQRMSKGLSHEPIHLWQQAVGLPFKYNPNERLADYIERQTKLQLYPNGYPIAVKYHEPLK